MRFLWLAGCGATPGQLEQKSATRQRGRIDAAIGGDG
jgi:hypothetical protein